MIPRSTVYKFIKNDGNVYYGFLMISPDVQTGVFVALVYSVVPAGSQSVEMVTDEKGAKVEARFLVWNLSEMKIEVHRED